MMRTPHSVGWLLGALVFGPLVSLGCDDASKPRARPDAGAVVGSGAPIPVLAEKPEVSLIPLVHAELRGSPADGIDNAAAPVHPAKDAGAPDATNPSRAAENVSAENVSAAAAKSAPTRLETKALRAGGEIRDDVWTLPETPKRWIVTAPAAAGRLDAKLTDAGGLPWATLVEVTKSADADTEISVFPTEPLQTGHHYLLAITVTPTARADVGKDAPSEVSWTLPVAVENGGDAPPWTERKPAPKKRGRRR